MKLRVFLFMTVLVLALAAGYFWRRLSADLPLEPAGRVILAASLTLSPTPLWIAQDQGLFARAGLDARVSDCATGKSCTEAMLRGEADLSAAAEFLAIRQAMESRELRILGTTAFVHTIKLQALRERGIATLADLRGKRVGVKLGTNGEYFLARLLTLNGLRRDDITWVDLKPQEMQEAMAEGRLDAVLVWPPFTGKIRNRFSDRLIEFDGQPGQDYYYLVLGRQEWLAANPRVAERVMLALKWAEEWMTAHPEETETHMSARLGLPLAALSEDLRNTRFAIRLPQTLLTALEAEQAWLLEQGAQGTAVANTLDRIAFRPLAAVAPESVTMLRGRRTP